LLRSKVVLRQEVVCYLFYGEGKFQIFGNIIDFPQSIVDRI